MSRKTVSMIGNLTRDMMSDVMETSLKKPIQTGEFRKNPVEPAWRCPAEYIYELVKTEQFVMEYLKPKQAVTGRVILQLHGGGYIGPMKNIYRRFAVKYSQISFGADVLTPDYRVAPEHPYPAALEDAVVLGDLFRESRDIAGVLRQYEAQRCDRVRDLVLKARKRCDVTHGKDMALTQAWYQELKEETGERIINGLCETIQGGPLG